MLWGEGTWTKETTAIESPRRAVELRRAEVDGGRESHVDGADGISDTVHPWVPRSGVGCGQRRGPSGQARTGAQRGAAGAGARRRSRTREIEARRNASGFKKTRGSSREGDDGQAASFGGDARVRRQAPGRRLHRCTLGADDGERESWLFIRTGHCWIDDGVLKPLSLLHSAATSTTYDSVVLLFTSNS